MADISRLPREIIFLILKNFLLDNKYTQEEKNQYIYNFSLVSKKFYQSSKISRKLRLYEMIGLKLDLEKITKPDTILISRSLIEIQTDLLFLAGVKNRGEALSEEQVLALKVKYQNETNSGDSVCAFVMALTYLVNNDTIAALEQCQKAKILQNAEILIDYINALNEKKLDHVFATILREFSLVSQSIEDYPKFLLLAIINPIWLKVQKAFIDLNYQSHLNIITSHPEVMCELTFGQLYDLSELPIKLPPHPVFTDISPAYLQGLKTLFEMDREIVFAVLQRLELSTFDTTKRQEFLNLMVIFWKKVIEINLTLKNRCVTLNQIKEYIKSNWIDKLIYDMEELKLIINLLTKIDVETFLHLDLVFSALNLGLTQKTSFNFQDKFHIMIITCAFEAKYFESNSIILYLINTSSIETFYLFLLKNYDHLNNLKKLSEYCDSDEDIKTFFKRKIDLFFNNRLKMAHEQYFENLLVLVNDFYKHKKDYQEQIRLKLDPEKKQFRFWSDNQQTLNNNNNNQNFSLLPPRRSVRKTYIEALKDKIATMEKEDIEEIKRTCDDRLKQIATKNGSRKNKHKIDDDQSNNKHRKSDGDDVTSQARMGAPS